MKSTAKLHAPFGKHTGEKVQKNPVRRQLKALIKQYAFPYSLKAYQHLCHGQNVNFKAFKYSQIKFKSGYTFRLLVVYNHNNSFSDLLYTSEIHSLVNVLFFRFVQTLVSD